MSRPISYSKTLGTSRVAPSRPQRSQQYGADDSAETRARQLGDMERSLKAATDAATAATTAKFVEVFISAVNATPVIRHGLGRRARWSVMRWKPTINGAPANLQEVAHGDEANTLQLIAQYSGTAELKVE